MRGPNRTLLAVVLTSTTACSQLPKDVLVDNPVPCIAREDIPKRPNLVTTAQLKQMNDHQATLALEGHRLRSEAYIEELEIVVDRCSKLTAPGSAQPR